MAELSPATQAVDRAIADRIQLLGEIAPSRQVAAAALRAIAARGEAVEIRTVPGPFEFDAVILASDLRAIADELESLPDDLN